MTEINKVGLLFAGHGSRDDEALIEFENTVHAVAKHFPNFLTTHGFLEFARPTIHDALEQLRKQEVQQILAVPGMLMAAGHAKNDIPSELNNYQHQHPEIQIQYATELGINHQLLQLAAARIESVEQSIGENYSRKNTLLLVVGRGASDSDANSNISKITRMLWEGMGFAWAETCYSGVTAPLIQDALPVVERMGYRHVIVFPYFLFTGRLVKKIYHTVETFNSTANKTKFICAPYLNNHELLVSRFVDIINLNQQAQQSMNCQLCQYREQIIGYEDSVGMVQVGHHHHVRGIGTDHDHEHHHLHHE
ncbi:MAG: sirohydrochlorin chelatase [Gammaproteobacteria bacterium]|nr:sirohydrochlorin chelatase [Gammaproteobacteria bacterium]MDH5727888.1 sirohydrochlorin chelatase [Gammaproteobacteria bacterium]